MIWELVVQRRLAALVPAGHALSLESLQSLFPSPSLAVP